MKLRKLIILAEVLLVGATSYAIADYTVLDADRVPITYKSIPCGTGVECNGLMVFNPNGVGGGNLSGNLNDAAVTTDSQASWSSKLRALVKVFGDAWLPNTHQFNARVGTVNARNSSQPLTLTGVSQNLLPVATGVRRYVEIKNQSLTNWVSCNWGGTAVINGAGSYDIPPRWSRAWPDTGAKFVPGDALNCAADADGVPITLIAF